MTPKTYSLLFVTLLGLAGCSSTPSKVDSGPIRASTFAFMESSAKSVTAKADTRKAVHASIQEAITQGLTDRGVTRASTDPDLLVGYLIILGNGAVTLSIDDYFGSGRSSYGEREKAHRAYTKVSNPNGFEAGTLVVDILDARSFKLLRRRHVTRPLLQEPADNVRQEHVREAVNETLQDLKIVH
jgi:hypothetical protein